MSTGIFKSFVSTVRPWRRGAWTSAFSLLYDSLTGAPVGIQSQNANGPDMIVVPVDLTAEQIASPTALMLADINATYRLNVAPWTRYRSNGTLLEAEGGGSPDGSTLPGTTLQTVPAGAPRQTIGASSYLSVFSPFTVQNDAGVAVLGTLYVVARPA